MKFIFLAAFAIIMQACSIKPAREMGICEQATAPDFRFAVNADLIRVEPTAFHLDFDGFGKNFDALVFNDIYSNQTVKVFYSPEFPPDASKFVSGEIIKFSFIKEDCFGTNGVFLENIDFMEGTERKAP